MTEKKIDKLRKLNIELVEETKNFEFWQNTKPDEISTEMTKHYERKVKKIEKRIDDLGGIPEDIID